MTLHTNRKQQPQPPSRVLPGFTPKRSLLTVSLHAALVGLAAGAMTLPQPAVAQESAAQASVQHFDIPAGPLDGTLDRFARTAGVNLSYDRALVAGRTSRGLAGQYGVRAGLQALLAGTDIEAHPQAGGGFTLKKAVVLEPRSGEATLTPVTVTADADRDGTTEGTGAYTPAGPLTTATPLGLTLRETPQSVSVMTEQRMADQGLLTIRDTLEQIPGISLVASGTERFQATSRGYQITNYQLDGVNSHSDYGGAAGPASQSLADMAMYDRVELIRGASGLVTGAGDPSGAINMVRKKPTREFRGAAEATLGSRNDRRGVADVSGPLNADRSVRGRAIAAAQDAGSHLDHYNRKQALIYGVLEADITSATRLTLGADHQRTRSKGSSTYVGFPLWFSDGRQTDLPVSTSLASRDNRFETESTTAFAALDQSLPGDWRLKISGAYGKSSQTEESVYLEANGRFADRVTGDGLVLDAGARTYDTTFKTVDANVRGPFSLFGRKHEATLGFTYEDYKKIADGYFDTSGLDGTPANLFNWNRSGKAVFNLKAIDWDAYREQYSLYAAGRFEISDGLKLIVGSRSINYKDRLHTANIYGYLYQPTSSEKGVLAPYGGLLYDIDDSHTAYVSYSTIYQPQYYRDRNGDLIAPRQGANHEAGIKSAWLGGKLNTAAAIYRIRQDNLTETDPGYILVPGTTAEYASRVIPGAETRGFDLEATGALTSNWNISASYTYSRTEDGNGKTVRTTFPRHIAKLWTTYRLPGDLNRLTLGGGVNWQSRIYNTVYSWALSRDLHWQQKAYTVANLMARYDFDKQLSATLNVNNVFDKKYIASATDWWYSALYGAPRSVTLAVKYKF